MADMATIGNAIWQYRHKEDSTKVIDVSAYSALRSETALTNPAQSGKGKESYERFEEYEEYSYDKGTKAWTKTGNKVPKKNSTHYDTMDLANTSRVDPTSQEWGAKDISKDDFVYPEGHEKAGQPKEVGEIYKILDAKLPGITGSDLVAYINEALPKYQAVPEEEKGFLAKEKEFAERTAEMGKETDIYGLQKEAGKVGAAMRGAYGGMGGGMRGAVAGQAAMGKGMERAYDKYGLGMEKAAFAEEKGLYGLEKTATTAYETDVGTTLQADWTTSTEGQAKTTEYDSWREGGRVPDKESFSNFLTQLPDAGGS